MILILVVELTGFEPVTFAMFQPKADRPLDKMQSWKIDECAPTWI